jgi:hypothetical protein
MNRAGKAVGFDAGNHALRLPDERTGGNALVLNLTPGAPAEAARAA